MNTTTKGSNFGAIISRRRKELHMTQQQLADILSITKSTISRYESGAINKMSSEHLIPMAKALRISPSQLLGLPESDVSVSTHENGTADYWVGKEALKDYEKAPEAINKFTECTRKIMFRGSVSDIVKATNVLKAMFPEYMEG